jgi:hypothetical protein
MNKAGLVADFLAFHLVQEFAGHVMTISVSWRAECINVFPTSQVSVMRVTEVLRQLWHKSCMKSVGV